VFRDGANVLVLDYERPAKASTVGGQSMTKGIEHKKETKKKPAKSLMEKRAAKAEKRSQKRQWGTR
jgi:hypothetical protein